MDEIPQIRIGRGSSNFYCNLIKAYLKNYERVLVIAGGYRINMAVWTCFLIYEEHEVSKVNSHFIDDTKIQTIFSFEVSRNPGRALNSYHIQSEYLPVLKICDFSTMRNYREAARENDINVLVAAGRMCAKAFFLISHLWHDGFRLRSLKIAKILGSNNTYKAAVRIEVYKNHQAIKTNAEVDERLRGKEEETSV